jgi:two-component system, NarL family, nitrate/nitrite response regulator NarL
MGTSVLIVDDHAGFRASARRMLEAGGFDVVAEAADCAGGLDAAGALHPDVVLLDVQLPDGDGRELASRIDGPTRVVLTSSRSRAELGEDPEELGACGFVPKDELSAASIRELTR